MNFELVVPIEFDVLDAAVNECLPGYAPAGWVEFERRPITPAATQYDMFLKTYGDLGDLGSLVVRKAGSQKSILHFSEPEKPRARQPSQEEWKNHNFASYPPEERIVKKLELFAKYREEAEDLHRRRREHQRKIAQALFSRLADDSATEAAFSGQPAPEGVAPNPLHDARAQLEDFRSFIERQVCRDLTEDGPPQEKHTRSLLQAFLIPRSYREVPVRAGRSDILVHVPGGRLLFETKIWRGEAYYSEGLVEISEYIKGENTDGCLLGAFYLLFDPTGTHKAISYLGSACATVPIDGFPLEVYVIDLAPDTPSKKGSA